MAGYIEKGVAEGATALCDGRKFKSESGGFYLGPTIFDNVTPEMTIAKEEIFRARAVGNSSQDAGRGHKIGESIAVWQCHLDIHHKR